MKENGENYDHNFNNYDNVYKEDYPDMIMKIMLMMLMIMLMMVMTMIVIIVMIVAYDLMITALRNGIRFYIKVRTKINSH